MSETPETDIELDRAGRYLHGEILDGTPSEIQYVEADFARRLETERDAAREALEYIANWGCDEAEQWDGPCAKKISDYARAILAKVKP